MNKIWLALLCFVLPICIFNACKKGPDNFTVGQELVNVNSNIVVNDTTTLHCCTVKSDSIVTSNTGEALVGRYLDNITLDTITATSYMQIGLPGSLSIDPGTICDSVVMFLHSNKYSYGDTVAPFTLEVYQLNENIDNNLNTNGFRYNTSQEVKYDTLIGQKTFFPKPGSSADITITMDPKSKNSLFNFIKNEVSVLPDATTKTAKFLSRFKGIALVSSKSNHSVLGFQASETQLYLRFYFRINQTSSTLDFAMARPDLQFNHIKDGLPAADDARNVYRTNLLNTLKKPTDVLPSTKTGNATYCQAGTAFMTKFEFPYIRNFQETQQHIKILKAELLIYPVRGSYNNIPLPTKLIPYITDEFNQVHSLAIPDTSKQQLVYDYLNREETYYIIDITSYASSLFQLTSDKNQVPAIITSFSYADNSTKLKRAIISDGLATKAKSTRLRITYWLY
jgi:protein involved in ribonucleotide reduction